MISNRPDVDPRISAYLDKETHVAEAGAIEEALNADPSLRRRLRTYRALQETLRDRFPNEALPDELRRRIELALCEEDARRAPSWTRTAASILLVMLISSVTTWLVLRGGQPKPDPSGKGIADHVQFPKELGVRYATVTGGPSGDEVRDLYASEAVLNAVRSNQPFPYGTIIVRKVYQAERDSNGVLVKDAMGNAKRSKLLFTAVMEKRPGAGIFPAGEWLFQSFAPDGVPIRRSPVECFACHDKMRNDDFVFSRDRMRTGTR